MVRHVASNMRIKVQRKCREVHYGPSIMIGVRWLNVNNSYFFPLPTQPGKPSEGDIAQSFLGQSERTALC